MSPWYDPSPHGERRRRSEAPREEDGAAIDDANQGPVGEHRLRKEARRLARSGGRKQPPSAQKAARAARGRGTAHPRVGAPTPQLDRGAAAAAAAAAPAARRRGRAPTRAAPPPRRLLQMRRATARARPRRRSPRRRPRAPGRAISRRRRAAGRGPAAPDAPRRWRGRGRGGLAETLAAWASFRPRPSAGGRSWWRCGPRRLLQMRRATMARPSAAARRQPDDGSRGPGHPSGHVISRR